ncbi:MAG: hypothetical protein OXC44_01310, partial [Proteobacteria bacterium]|nr:hypothetical protein [Pseudomonadota bacterium]
PPENNDSLVLKKGSVFVSYGNTFKIDKVFDHKESFALMDGFGSHRGLCGSHMDNYDPDYYERINSGNAGYEINGVPGARELYYNGMSLLGSHGECQIVCEHSVQDLASSFKRGYMDLSPTGQIPAGEDGGISLGATEHEDGKEIAQRITAKFNAFKDSRSCEIHSFQGWKESSNNRVTHDDKEELAWMRYGSKLYINHFEKNKNEGAFHRGKVIPFSDYLYLYAGKKSIYSEGFGRDHTLSICSSAWNYVFANRNRQSEGNTVGERLMTRMFDAYAASTSSPDSLPSKENLSGKCMRVCNITEKRDQPECNVKRVGREYIKLHEFFGGLKASFCSVGERKNKIEGFIEEIKGAKNTFSQWNPGMLSPEDDPEGNKIEFAVEKVSDINSHVFDGPIQSIELKDGPGNEDNFVASIEVGKAKNGCVIKALNRYIHTSSKLNELRLMIHKAHFAAENCVDKGKLYLEALKKLEASQNSEDDKSDSISITFKFKKEEDQRP